MKHPYPKNSKYIYLMQNLHIYGTCNYITNSNIIYQLVYVYSCGCPVQNYLYKTTDNFYNNAWQCYLLYTKVGCLQGNYYEIITIITTGLNSVFKSFKWLWHEICFLPSVYKLQCRGIVHVAPRHTFWQFAATPKLYTAHHCY